MRIIESKKNIPDIKLTVQSGGILVFEKTEILSEFLIFHSNQLQRTWRLKLKENKQNGFLKVNGLVAFNYFFDGLGCTMPSVVNGVIDDEWEIEEVVIATLD